MPATALLAEVVIVLVVRQHLVVDLILRPCRRLVGVVVRGFRCGRGYVASVCDPERSNLPVGREAPVAHRLAVAQRGRNPIVGDVPAHHPTSRNEGGTEATDFMIRFLSQYPRDACAPRPSAAGYHAPVWRSEPPSGPLPHHGAGGRRLEHFRPSRWHRPSF